MSGAEKLTDKEICTEIRYCAGRLNTWLKMAKERDIVVSCKTEGVLHPVNNDFNVGSLSDPTLSVIRSVEFEFRKTTVF